MTVRIHQLKITPACFDAVVSGEQRAVPVKDGLDYKVGDVFSLREWGIDGKYTGKEWAAVITHIFLVSDALPMCDRLRIDRWIMISIRPLTTLQALEYVLTGGEK